MFAAPVSRLIALVTLAVPVMAAAVTFEMTPPKQALLDRQKEVISAWARDAVLVQAVTEQNTKGPMAGMDNLKWKTLRGSDEIVKGLANNSAAKFLQARMDESDGLVSEVFLSAAQGEKVAFVEKTSSYIHKGAPKFDVPFTSGQPWQGKPEFDESSQTFAVQVSVPVVDGGRNIGVLVVGLNLSKLEKLSKAK